MGTEHNDDLMFFAHGAVISPMLGAPMVTFEPDDKGCIVGVNLSQGYDFTVTCRVKFPHVTRLELIQYLLKIGYIKRDAKKIAWHAHKNKIPYSHVACMFSLSADFDGDPV